MNTVGNYGISAAQTQKRAALKDLTTDYEFPFQAFIKHNIKVQDVDELRDSKSKENWKFSPPVLFYLF